LAKGALTKVPVPGISPCRIPQCTFTGSLEVNISCIAGATIHYTMDGNDPTEASATYAGPLTLTKDTTLKARGYKSGLTPSDIASAEYHNLVAPTSPVAPARPRGLRLK
jgi:hypothetical protein